MPKGDESKPARAPCQGHATIKYCHETYFTRGHYHRRVTSAFSPYDSSTSVLVFSLPSATSLSAPSYHPDTLSRALNLSLVVQPPPDVQEPVGTVTVAGIIRPLRQARSIGGPSLPGKFLTHGPIRQHISPLKTLPLTYHFHYRASSHNLPQKPSSS